MLQINRENLCNKLLGNILQCITSLYYFCYTITDMLQRLAQATQTKPSNLPNAPALHP